MGALLVPIVILVVLLVLGAVWLRRWGSERQRVTDDLRDPTTPTLDYQVPDGQDPVVLLTALSQEGYECSVDPANTRLVRVSCPAGLDRHRARVRQVIVHAGSTSLEGGPPLEPEHVRFLDET